MLFSFPRNWRLALAQHNKYHEIDTNELSNKEAQSESLKLLVGRNFDWIVTSPALDDFLYSEELEELRANDSF